jgi:predicted  nucleic acid-binding Zn-ribbon protein
MSLKYWHTDFLLRLFSFTLATTDAFNAYMQRRRLVTQAPLRRMTVAEAQAVIAETKRAIGTFEELLSELDQEMEAIWTEYRQAGFDLPHPTERQADLARMVDGETDQSRIDVLQGYGEVVKEYEAQKAALNKQMAGLERTITKGEALIESQMQSGSSRPIPNRHGR